MGYQNIRYYTPYHVFNPFQINPRNNFILDISKDSIKYPFSQIGYQIMNPQMISYRLEPIYSRVSSKIKIKGSSVEIGKPVYDSYSYNNYKNNFSTISHYQNSEIKSYSDKGNYLPSTNDKTKSRTTLRRKIYESLPKFNSKLKDSVSPLIHLIKEKNKSNIKSKSTIIKKRTQIEWLKLFKNFVNINTFFSSAKKYSCLHSKLRNKLINERIENVVNDIAIIKDWIISIEESFFDEFKNHENFSGELYNIQGEKNVMTKKNVLRIIKIFINNLKSNSNLDDIPENVQNILYKYIKDNSYFPKKYLSKFEINRIDFNFYGETRNISELHSAMILSYFIINGVTVQQILLHIKDVFIEYNNSYNVEKAAINLGSVLHYIVKKTFEKKLKVKNDVIALFNYYRSYHLFDKKIEKLKDKFNQKIIIEENENDDEYNKNLLPLNDIKIFFNENNQIIEEFMDSIYNWAIELSKNLRNNFFSPIDISIRNKNKNKKTRIRSKIIKAD